LPHHITFQRTWENPRNIWKNHGTSEYCSDLCKLEVVRAQQSESVLKFQGNWKNLIANYWKPLTSLMTHFL
jgi:hypothetical protein